MSYTDLNADTILKRNVGIFSNAYQVQLWVTNSENFKKLLLQTAITILSWIIHCKFNFISGYKKSMPVIKKISHIVKILLNCLVSTYEQSYNEDFCLSISCASSNYFGGFG